MEWEPRVARYANSFSVGHSNFEFILDFGQSQEGNREPLVHTRIVTGPAYAKALSMLLIESLERYESEFGPIPDLTSEGPQNAC